MMKEGDIVYFKSAYKARYGRTTELGGNYDYHFKPGDRYRIEIIRNNLYKTGSIINLEDGTSHFASSEMWERIATKEEWREIQLSKLIQ
jgi:hypothetical protein